MTPDEYRKKHRRCATCHYKHLNSLSQYFCMAKGTVQRNMLVPEGMFCKLYKPIKF